MQQPDSARGTLRGRTLHKGLEDIDNPDSVAGFARAAADRAATPRGLPQEPLRHQSYHSLSPAPGAEQLELCLDAGADRVRDLLRDDREVEGMTSSKHGSTHRAVRCRVAPSQPEFPAMIHGPVGGGGD